MLSRNVACILFLAFCCMLAINGDKTALFIQGFVPRDNPTFVVTSLEPAAYLAVKDINDRMDILVNYTLNLTFVDTKCDPAEATWQLIRSVIRRDREDGTVVMLLGGGCSPATEPLAALAGLFYNLTQVSYSSTTPSLSDKTKYNHFFRTIPNEVFVSKARYALMKEYNWGRVALLYETQTIYATAVQEFINNVSITGVEDRSLLVRSFTRDPTIHLQRIKDQDYRIIFAWFYEEKGLKTFCEAIQLELVTRDHLWVMPAFDRNWWKNNDTDISCSMQQLRNALQYVFFVDTFPWDPNATATSISGRDRASFDDSYNYTPSSNIDVGHLYASFAYDAVWAIALALNATVANGTRVENFTYDNKEIADQLREAMANVNFKGISGDISFNEGERVGHTAIYQYRECNCARTKCNQSDLLYEMIALNDQSDPELGLTLKNGYTEDCIWYNRQDGQPPKDRRTPVYEHLSHGLIHTCFVLTPLAVIFLATLLVFNNVMLRQPLIANSAPHMNNVILGGTILMALTTISLSFDSNYPREFEINDTVNATISKEAQDRYSSWCIVRLWLLSIGFTLSFGSLFSKMWQIYRLYTNPKLKNQPLSLWNFFVPLGVFLFLDIALLIPWTILFPLEWNEDLSISEDGNTEVHYEYCSCDRFGYWIGALYVYKGLLVVFSLFLAYESRNVKSYYVNDSRYVIVSMLSAVLLIGTGAPVSLVLSVFFIHNGAYIVAVLCILLACVCSAAILFIPKMVWMYQGKATFITGSVPPDDNTTQDDHYRSSGSSSDNKSTDNTGLEMSSHRKKEKVSGNVKDDNTVETAGSGGSANTENDSGVQPDELAYHCK